VELDAVHERVVIDRARVGGTSTKGLEVALPGAPHVGARAENGTSSIESTSICAGPTRYLPPTLTFGRRHSRNETVMSPAATSSRNSGLNCTFPLSAEVRLDIVVVRACVKGGRR
jgi:hypothetical protein